MAFVARPQASAALQVVTLLSCLSYNWGQRIHLTEAWNNIRGGALNHAIFVWTVSLSQPDLVWSSDLKVHCI
jgi:hypothetical protein